MAILVEPGKILRDRYIIREIIGRGGMGSIFLAEDNRLPGRLCAVKQITHDQDLPDTIREQTKEQFYREASVLARLDHPNLPKVSDFFSAPDSDYLVMDFVPGDDLKTLMDGARRKGEFLDQEEVLEWATQLADALAYLHGQDPPVIHRDIKPSNMRITPNRLLKLVDFGLVKQMVPDEMTITIIQGRGTALYTPLEQYGGDAGHTDPRSDIYAFGATLYHLLTNQPPIEAKQRFLNPYALRPLQEFNPDVDPQVESAILWAMSLHPDERPQEITSFSESLLGDQPIPSTVHQQPFNAKQIFNISTPDKVLIGIASLLLLLAVIGTIL
ncbi:MAG: serine/threonine-protein kinase [Anaerolineales bacterium]